MPYTHAELTARFMMGFQPAKCRGRELWVAVKTAFACGSTAAREICKAHGMDPDMMVKQRRI